MACPHEQFKKGERDVVEHPGKELSSVLADVFSQYPEESFYFLNEGVLRRTAEIFQEYFLPSDDRRRIAYAVKANPHPEVLRILSESGINAFDCASGGEIESVFSVNHEAEIFFNHPHKKQKEIVTATQKGVRHFTADILAEVEKILSITKHPEIALRLKTLNPEGAAINLSEKFGLLFEEVRQLLPEIQKQGAIPCLSMNVGSQVWDRESYRRNFLRLVELVRDTKTRVMAVNLGGGIPVRIQDSVDQNHDLLRCYLQEMTDVIGERVDEVLLSGEKAKIIIEPGRSMVASAVDLAISILNVREGNPPALYIDDGVFTSFSDADIHGWKYVMRGIDDQGKEILDRSVRDYILCGRTCDSGDVIRSQSLVEGLTTKDYVQVPNAGAYLSSQAAINFNGYPAHRYVLYNS